MKTPILCLARVLGFADEAVGFRFSGQRVHRFRLNVKAHTVSGSDPSPRSLKAAVCCHPLPENAKIPILHCHKTLYNSFEPVQNRIERSQAGLASQPISPKLKTRSLNTTFKPYRAYLPSPLTYTNLKLLNLKP